MSVSIYFGLPGSGKTTLAVKHIIDGKKKGLNVYTNIPVNIDGVYLVGKDDLGEYDIHDGLLIWDEASIDFDNRDFKSFTQKAKVFNLLHRHARLDLRYYTQKYDGVDSKIRSLASKVYWVRKMKFRRNISKAISVPYGVYIPERGDTANVGEIINGYYRPSWLDRLFAEKVKRKKYYKYFDSWELPDLKPLPENRRINSDVIIKKREGLIKKSIHLIKKIPRPHKKQD